ncbi:hypothetical protein M9Y10_026008 [Tritrichomonas musculus]|uniref:Uncharacterized protein n=1 Tax=Tritrichomonas musculus TaxID=1915356 RepID=A0ABR2H885_9EUKA
MEDLQPQVKNETIEQNKLIFALNKKEKTASGDLFIPRSIKHDNEYFVVESIKERAFQNLNSISSIIFPPDSEIKRIEKDSFLFSSIEQLFIPSSILYLEEGFCRGTPNLKHIKMMPNHQEMMYVDNKTLVGKSESSSDEYDVLLFVRRDVKHFDRTHYDSKRSFEIGEGAFYKCDKLQDIEIPLNSKLQKIETLSFIKTSIKSIKIPSSVIKLSENFCEEKTKILRDAEYYKHSADQGDIESMFNYAVILEEGNGIDKNKKEASHYYKLAADHGHVDAMVNYAFMLYDGDGIDENKKESAHYYKLSADQGNVDAMFYYANMLYDGDGIEKNKKESAHYYKLSADQGNVKAMFYYANMLYDGDGIEKNKKESAHYYKLAADHGHVDAMVNYAFMLHDGDGIEENKKESAYYYKLSADQGNVDAMFNYAFMLYNGDGIEENKKEASHYYKLAADQGQVDSMLNYALMLYDGDGIEKNKKESAHYYKLAVDHGHVDAMVNYAFMLHEGDGIDKNKIEAVRYYKLAADQGFSNAKEQYKNLTRYTKYAI